MSDLESLSREELQALVEVYAKNWLAHDGSWFLAAEEAYGTDAAIALDVRAWSIFAAAEARRIKQVFGLPAQGGLAALVRALDLRAYARINRQTVEWAGAGTLVLRMDECRVQQTRQRKGLPPFPCRPVGEMEFATFAQTIDPRIRTRCLGCPPHPAAHGYCAWEFTLKEDDEST